MSFDERSVKLTRFIRESWMSVQYLMAIHPAVIQLSKLLKIMALPRAMLPTHVVWKQGCTPFQKGDFTGEVQATKDPKDGRGWDFWQRVKDERSSAVLTAISTATTEVTDDLMQL